MSNGSLSDAVKMALQYAKEASERVRRVVVLLTLASIVTFIAWWNQYSHSWTTARLQTAQDALRFVCEQARHEPESAANTAWIGEACHQTATAVPLTAAQTAEAADFLKDWQFTRKQLERHIQDIQDQFVAGVLKINVPFFGLTSDVNDLGILSGIALTSLLSLFLFTLWREEQNLRQLFELAKAQKVLPQVLRLYAMTQVFTIPPWYHEPAANRVTASIYSLPLGCYALVAAYDCWQMATLPHTWRTTLDWVTLTVELSTLSAIVVMRIVGRRITRSMDRVWSSALNSVTGEASAETVPVGTA